MRKYKLRLSAIIPSKWFHKLRNMTKPRKKNHPPYSLNITNNESTSSKPKYVPHSSNSYFSNRSHTSLEAKILQISPRNSVYMAQRKRKSVYKPSTPSSSSVSASFNKSKIKFLPNQDSSATSSNLKLSSSADDIIIDMKNMNFKKNMLKENKVSDLTKKACPASKLTKESRKTHHLSVKVNNKEKEEEDACRIQKKHQKTLVLSGRRSSANSPRIKLRVNSPRLQVSPRKSKSRSQSRQVVDSYAVIKSSIDPKKDFRESMVEMITENNIRAYKDLEDLLACYLSLNPKEYRDLIIKVFVQVWFEVINSTFASK